MEQYLTYPHEGHLQDRIAEGILHTIDRSRTQSRGRPH
jgi:alcohol dehydrogenase YqhD (iron-dependent ADH family)